MNLFRWKLLVAECIDGFLFNHFSSFSTVATRFPTTPAVNLSRKLRKIGLKILDRPVPNRSVRFSDLELRAFESVISATQAVSDSNPTFPQATAVTASLIYYCFDIS